MTGGRATTSQSGRVLAVDLGATSVRVAAVDLASSAPAVEVVHRWPHAPVVGPDGHLRWDWPALVREVTTGLEVGLAAGPVASIGIDGWGVDYGLIGADGELLEPPFSYRDARTAGWREVELRVGAERIFAITGTQAMGINTIFQLAYERQERLERASRLLLLPDLLVHQLTGFVGAEVSNMSTTGLMDARERAWSDALIAAVGAPRRLFPPPVSAGANAGSWRGVPVTVVGSHDTASAFLGAPSSRSGDGAPRDVFVSAGSWVLVGVERQEPDTSQAARRLNFSNEAGALGGVRFLKNVVGFWVLERCREAWGGATVAELVAEAAEVDGEVPRFDATDHRFVGPGDMLAQVLSATGLPADAPRALVVRSVLESIVDAVVRVIGELDDVLSEPTGRIVLVGGGARIALFADLLAARSGRKTVTGSAEATALGNAVVQGIALGRFADREAASGWLAQLEEER